MLQNVLNKNKGIDFFDTYSLGTKINIIRVIVFAIIYKLQIHQIDVKTTILNDKLNEEIYIDQPKVFITFGHEKINL